MKHELVKTVEECLLSGDEDKSYSGFVWLPEKGLLDYCYKKGMDTSDIGVLVEKGELIYYQEKNKGYLTTPYLAECENKLAENIVRLLLQPKKTYGRSFLLSLIEKIEKESGFSLHFQQKEAIICGVNSNVCVITGGPGTGKTLTLNILHKVIKLINKYEKICYAAPTGKAARRITESTGNYAQTLHKMFKLVSETSTPKLFQGDVLVIDESSMNDVIITAKITGAVSSGKRIIFVGDTEQLPSVGPGAVLRDLIDTGIIPVVRLMETFRQANESVLFQNIKRIQMGDSELEDGKDFCMYKADEQIEKQILTLFLKEVDIYGIENVCLLTPMRRSGRTSSNRMNKIIQANINPKGKNPFMETSYGYYQVGDLVMQLVNREECANGDVGKVIKADSSGIKVKYADCVVSYKKGEVSQISLAYCMTVHKAQGSEYKSVITLLLKEHRPMLQRNLFYTAVTRAKEKCIFIYEEGCLEKAIRNIENTKRKTLLVEKIEYFYEKCKMLYDI